MKKPAADTTARKLGRPFKSGKAWTGNRLGRPKGSRHKLSEAFIAALCADFEEHGPAVIAKVRQTKPAEYVRIIASLLPKQLNLTTDPFAELGDQELLMMIEQLRAMAH